MTILRINITNVAPLLLQLTGRVAEELDTRIGINRPNALVTITSAELMIVHYQSFSDDL